MVNEAARSLMSARRCLRQGLLRKQVPALSRWSWQSVRRQNTRYVHNFRQRGEYMPVSVWVGWYWVQAVRRLKVDVQGGLRRARHLRMPG